MAEEGEHQFEEIANAFSFTHDETFLNLPFADERSVFEEEAPSSAQRRYAFDFYNGLSLLMERQQGLYPSPFTIVELHQRYLETLRASIPPGEIEPEFTLIHVIGASKRLLAFAETADANTSEAAYEQARKRQISLEIYLDNAAHLEAVDYPVVLHRDAVHVQQTFWQEAQAFLARSHPEYAHWLTLPKITPGSYPFLQFFPEEHPDEVIRKSVSSAARHIAYNLQRVRQRIHHLKRFGMKEALVSATNFGHDDIDKYSLKNVLGASKREVLSVDLQHGWNDSARDTFAANNLLEQAVEETHHS